MAQQRRFPAGVQDFEKIRTEGFVYIDKTEYIFKLANNYGDALFLSRPRRFGKSLLCSTLKYYFQGRKDLFEGLAIDKLEKNWTQYPVLHFDMSACKKDDINEIGPSLDFSLSQFEDQYDCKKGDLGFGSRLQQLVLKAHQITGQRVVLIFDEYDSPVLNVINEPEKMDAIRSIFNSFYGPVKYMAEHLRFVFITGITKFSQMSIFSTINNLTNLSFDTDMEGLCGITAQELEEDFKPEIEILAAKENTTHEDAIELLRERYDGYHFGSDMTEIYNPFSLLHTFRTNQLRNYWFSSATPAALLKVLKIYNFELNNLENTRLREEDFDQPFDNMDSAIPILYQSGYLTIKDCKKSGSVFGARNIYTLGIPNQEVYDGLYSTLMPHYLKTNVTQNSNLLINVREAMDDDDIDAALAAVRDFLAALPYDLSNKSERDFETLIYVLFKCVGIEVQAEVKNARGRCDVVLRTRTTIYVLELKISTTATVDEALAQIDDKNYLIPFHDDPRPKVKVGVTINPELRTLSEWKVVRE